MPTPSKWTSVQDYFKGPYSLTFGSDLYVPKQDFLLFFSPECCFVLGTDQFPLTAVLTSWELPAMMCPGSPSSYVTHRHKMLQHSIVSADHVTMAEWSRERKGWDNVQVDIAILNKIHQYLLYPHDFSRYFPITLFQLSRKPWNQRLYPILIHTAALQSSLLPLSLPLQENHSPWGTPAVPYLIWIVPSSFYFGEQTSHKAKINTCHLLNIWED